MWSVSTGASNPDGRGSGEDTEKENEPKVHPIFSRGIITSARIMIKLWEVHKINNVEHKTRALLIMKIPRNYKIFIKKENKPKKIINTFIKH